MIDVDISPLEGIDTEGVLPCTAQHILVYSDTRRFAGYAPPCSQPSVARICLACHVCTHFSWQFVCQEALDHYYRGEIRCVVCGHVENVPRHAC